jgi:hypothetical protein
VNTVSLNIQTSNGLLEIGGSSIKNITDDGSDNLSVQDTDGNVIAKIDEDGITTTNINTKTLILNGQDIEKKIEEIASSSSGGGSSSDFSGDYNDLANKPSIKEDNLSELTIEDTSGNIIMKVDEEGLHTTDVAANTLILDGTSLKIETWTFTFADGSTETKKVVVG